MVESLTNMMRQMEASQKAAITEVREESAAQLRELRCELDQKKRKSL